MVLRYIQVCTYIYNSSILPLTFASLPFPPIISKKTFHPSSLSSLSTLSSLIHPSINYDLAIKSAQTSYYVLQQISNIYSPLHPPKSHLPSPSFPSLPLPSISLLSPQSTSTSNIKEKKDQRKNQSKNQHTPLSMSTLAVPSSIHRSTDIWIQGKFSTILTNVTALLFGGCVGGRRSRSRRRCSCGGCGFVVGRGSGGGGFG